MKEKDYKYWEKVLTKELFSLWKKSIRFLPCHGPDHHLRVWNMAAPFGLQKKADMEILVAACLLHDVYCFNAGVPEDHDTGSAKIAKRILTKAKFPKEKIIKVIKAILGHRSKNHITSLEGNIAKSFDKIDAFGPIGVYRVIAPFSIRKYGAKEIISWALVSKRLDKKWDSIVFPELKKKYKKEYLYSKKYFSDLAAALKIGKLPKRNIIENSIYSK